MRYRVFRLDFHTKRRARSLKPSGASYGRSGSIRSLLPGEEESRNKREETKWAMLTNMMKRGFIPMLLLALWWPSPVGYYILLGFAVCMGAIWAVHASSADKYFREADYVRVPCKVKYENQDQRSHRSPRLWRSLALQGSPTGKLVTVKL